MLCLESIILVLIFLVFLFGLIFIFRKSTINFYYKGEHEDMLKSIKLSFRKHDLDNGLIIQHPRIRDPIILPDEEIPDYIPWILKIM